MKGEITKGLYSIENFLTMADGEPGGYGFAVVLSAPVATRFLQMKRSDGGNFVEELRQLIIRRFGRSAEHNPEPDFFGDTWLLLGIKVPGNCACFGVDGSTRGTIEKKSEAREPLRRDLRYSPHNLDTLEQAAAILAVWLYWFNTILAGTDFDLPHAM
jgi:hypothetical protein